MSEERRRLQVTFRKSEGARFLSHLDLMSTLEFGLRRARIPVELSEGFNPRPRISLAAPLAVGHTGERELMEITLRDPISAEQLQERLQASLPPGITILSVAEMPIERKSAASRVESATYQIRLPEPASDLAGRIEELLTHEALPIEEERDGKTRRRDVRPYIASLETQTPDTLSLTLLYEAAGSVRPEQVLTLLELPVDGTTITRERINIRG